MPGFRPGKVPKGMIKKMYGKGVLAEEVNVTVQTNFKKMVTVNKDNGELIFTDPNPLLQSSISYNGYGIFTVPWLDDNYIWAYSGENELPIWVNYQFKDLNVYMTPVNLINQNQGLGSDNLYSFASKYGWK